MATIAKRWLYNLYGLDKPLVMPGLFQAGATQAVKAGELIELTGDSNTAWVPLDSDFAMSANVAIAAEEIKSGDRAGYYPIIVPRPGDVFEYELATAGDAALGAPVYFSSSEKVTTSAGTNVLGDVATHHHYPQMQGHLADDASGDAGTTIKDATHVGITIKAACSFWAAIQQ